MYHQSAKGSESIMEMQTHAPDQAGHQINAVLSNIGSTETFFNAVRAMENRISADVHLQTAARALATQITEIGIPKQYIDEFAKFEKASSISLSGLPSSYAVLLSVSCLGVLGLIPRSPRIIDHLTNIGLAEIAMAQKLVSNLAANFFGKLLVETGSRVESSPIFLPQMLAASTLLEQIQLDSMAASAIKQRNLGTNQKKIDWVLVTVAIVVAYVIADACNMTH
jgi:hypothetical protein